MMMHLDGRREGWPDGCVGLVLGCPVGLVGNEVG